MKVKELIISVCAAFFSGTAADASILSYTFSGQVNLVSGAELNSTLGQTLSISFLVDSTPNFFGAFEVFNWMATVGEFSQSAPTGGAISLGDGFPGASADAFEFLSIGASVFVSPTNVTNLVADGVSVGLFDFQGTSITSFDTLPLSFNLSSFELSTLSFSARRLLPNGFSEGIVAQASINSASVSEVIPQVPIPGALPLMGSALLSAGFAFRRRLSPAVKA